MPDQCVVAMGVDDVEVAEILGGVAPCKLPGHSQARKGSDGGEESTLRT